MRKRKYDWTLVYKRGYEPLFFELCKGFSRIGYDSYLIYKKGIIRIYSRIADINSEYDQFLKDIKRDPLKNLEDKKDGTYSVFQSAVNWAKKNHGKISSFLDRNDLSDEEFRQDVLTIMKELKGHYLEIGETIWKHPIIAGAKLKAKIEHMVETKVIEENDKEFILSTLCMTTEPTLPLKEAEGIVDLATKAEVKGFFNDLNKKIDELEMDLKRGKYKATLEYPDVFYKYEILRRAIEVLKEREDLRDSVRKHTLEYAWLGKEYEAGKPLSDLDFFEKLARLLIDNNPQIKKRIISLQPYRWETVRSNMFDRYKDLLEKDNGMVSYKTYSDIISTNSAIRFKRRNTITQIDTYMEPLLNQIQRRYFPSNADSSYANTGKGPIYSLFLDEIVHFLETGEKSVDMKEVGERKSCLITRIQKGVMGLGQEFNGRLYLCGEEALDFEKKLVQTGVIQALDVTREELKEGKPLKGIPRYGFLGLESVEGYAKIVTTSHDLMNIEPGDIIVTTMIVPSYIEYLDKIKGVLTEEGGLECHVLTIYHQFGWKIGVVPIITDVDGITDVLVNGDHIQIDASGEISLKNQR